jgi:3-oxoacyl-[acyl-carrier-protein] synthase-3
VDTSDEWITQRTGIKRRRVAAPDESTLTMAGQAAAVAIKDAGLSVDDVDEIIVATDTPEVYTPDTAALLQNLLGCGNVPTYDLGGSGCAGFVQGLDVARARIAFSPRTVLVVGVELITRLIDWRDRTTAVLFGDAAGAVVLGPEAGRATILDVVSGTDGSAAGILTLTVGGTRHPFNQDALDSGAYNRLIMDGRRVFTEAVTRMSAAASEVLARIGKTVDDVALVIPHQANLRIIEAIAQYLELPLDRFFINVGRYGNTSAASIPLALDEARRAGRIKAGDLTLLVAFGAGLTYGSALIRW